MKLVVENLEKNFGDNKVLKKINFEFSSGKIYGLLGRNGAGKTTLFNCINNDFDYKGKIYYKDTDSPIVHSDDIGFTISEPVVPEFLTGREFLRFFIDINKERIKDLKTEEEYFEMMNIDLEDMDKLIKEYSFGMKNKIQMLVNIILDTKVLLLDEPLTSLDVVVAEEMKNIFRKIKKDRVLIFSTHIMDLAVDLCDEIVILKDGQLIQVEGKDINKEYIMSILKGELDEYTS